MFYEVLSYATAVIDSILIKVSEGFLLSGIFQITQIIPAGERVGKDT